MTCANRVDDLLGEFSLGKRLFRPRVAKVRENISTVFGVVAFGHFNLPVLPAIEGRASSAAL
jgi:hypothetical protein